MLSSFHDESNITRRQRTKWSATGTETIKKPRMIEEYKRFMGGVDQSDQILSYYGFAHRSTKWWKWAFYHLLDLTLVNAQILYNSVSDKQLTQLYFRIEVAKGLLEDFLPNYTDTEAQILLND